MRSGTKVLYSLLLTSFLVSILEFETYNPPARKLTYPKNPMVRELVCKKSKKVLRGAWSRLLTFCFPRTTFA